MLPQGHHNERGKLITEYRGRQFTTAPGLRVVRERLGLSQMELERRSGLHRNQIMRIENGRNTTLKSLDKLAKALGVDSEVLRSEEPPEKTGSRFEIDAEGAGEVEENYLHHFAGGESMDGFYEAD